MFSTCSLGLEARCYEGARPLLVGGGGIPIEEFLRTPVGRWVA